MTRTALVVDDSMLIRHTVCRFLEERGYGVESATNGLDALERSQDIRPDILITDMMMPKMDGTPAHHRVEEKPIDRIASRSSSSPAAKAPPVFLPKHRANATIWKDIDIVSQLEKALGETLPSAG